MHPLTLFRYCPVCGSSRFDIQDEKSKCCRDCGFEYYLNPCAANASFILNDRRELLVVTRLKEPARGTYDLPGGFVDIGETAEEAVAREVKEETSLTVTHAEYLFSLPNSYTYSGFQVKTLDSFYLCTVADLSVLQTHDDAGEHHWIPLDQLRPEQFGLQSIRQGVARFIEMAQQADRQKYTTILNL